MRELRTAAGLSQESLAERALLSVAAISALERGARRAPQLQTMGLLAEALRLDQPERARLESAAAAGRHRQPRVQRLAADVPALDNLPNLLTSFHGREQDVADIAELLATRRLVTLVGPGGVGKTRLALEAAQGRIGQSRFDNGVWFVELAALRTSPFVAAAIAAILNIREQLNEPPIETLVGAIGNNRLLIVLDNCEHIIDECAAVAHRLTRDCAGVTILATSREALRLDGECVVRVEPLSFELSSGAAPALELFTDRLVDADFARFSRLSDDDRARVETICRQLDGLPLALELAASRSRDLSLAQIITGLENRFGLLNQGMRTAPTRQQTLAGMIDWSFALISPAEQQLFSRLAIFAEAFTPEAAVAICGNDRTLATRDELAALIAKSLIEVVQDASGRLRYRLLQTMRSFALDRLRESGDEDTIARQFAQYFTAAAKRADDSYGRVAHESFLALIESDIDNFRAALEWTLGKNNDLSLGAELAGAMGWVFRQKSLFAEGTMWCERALKESALIERRVQGRLHMALSFFAFNVGELNRALDAAGAATAIYRAIGAHSDLAWALTQQAYCMYLLGQPDSSRRAIIEAVALARRYGDALRLAGALNAYALSIPIDRAHERVAPLEEAIRVYRSAGDQSAIVPICNLAEAYFATGDKRSALQYGLEVVALTRQSRDRMNLAGALTNAAAYALALDDLDEAYRSAHEALELVRDIGKSLNAMCAFAHLGSICARRGQFVQAARLQGASDQLYREFGLRREFTEQWLAERTIEAIRRELGDAELNVHLTDGASMPFKRAVEEALIA